jgi:hypothetical protein
MLPLVALPLAAFTVARAQPLQSTPAVAPPPGPASWLQGATLLTMYGRGFSTAPVLGRLGLDRNFGDVANQFANEQRLVRLRSGLHRTRLAIHLIYAMATPCQSADTCLAYLDETGVDLVKQYIEPAARRGWLVILDDQLSRSNPVSEMQRMQAKGYFRYDNVEVAFDPEFRTQPGQTSPGVPLGSVSAGELNAAQALLSRYSRTHHLPHRKLLLVHEWTPSMITQAERLRGDFPYVQPILVMDGIGTPAEKMQDYKNLFEDRFLPPGVMTGIKLFPPGQYTLPGQVDLPVMNWQQVFGRASVNGIGDRGVVLRPAPRVIVLT